MCQYSKHQAGKRQNLLVIFACAHQEIESSGQMASSHLLFVQISIMIAYSVLEKGKDLYNIIAEHDNIIILSTQGTAEQAAP